MSSLCWLLAFVLMVKEIKSQICFSTRFPRVLGGTLSSTSFKSVDMDSSGNIIVGGSTQDASLSNMYNSPDPILLNIQSGNTYLWGASFKGNNFDSVGAVKFSTAGTYIFAALTSSSNPLYIAVVQSSNALVLRVLKYGGKFFKFHRIGQMIKDSTDNIYVGHQEVVLGGYNYLISKFSLLGATPFTIPFKTSFKSPDKNPEFGAHTLVFTNSNAGILVSGSFSTTSSSTWSIGFAYFDVKTADFKYIYAANTTDKLKRVTNLDVSSASTAWGCGDFNQTDLLIFNAPVSTDVLPTGITTGLWTAQNIQCLGITAYTSIDAYLVAASSASSNDVRLIKASKVAGPSIQVSQYNFENTLSGASTNLLNGAFFQQGSSKFYLLGNTKYFGGNLARSFTTDLGYIMEADYLLLGAQNQCLLLTLAYSASLILPSASILIWSQAYMETRNIKFLDSGSSDTSTVTQALKSLTLIDQSSWCGPQTTVTFTISPFTAQTYNVGVAGQTTTISFTNFAIAQTCSDAIYTYTALMSTTAAALPTFLVFNPTLRSFDWSAAIASDAGTYNVDVTGKLNNGQTQVWVFTLTINSCATAVLSTSPVSTINYYQNGSPYTVNISPFTSSVSTASCGSISYLMEGPAGSGSLQAQYTFNSATISLVINCNLCLPDGTSQNLKLTGTQGTVSTFITFAVTFLTSCTAASVIAPQQQTTMTIKVTDSIQTLAINSFSSSIKGCEANLIYSCPGCSSSLIFTFTSPNLMIEASTNEAVGTQQIEVYAYFSLPASVFQKIVVNVNPDCTQLSPSGDFITNTTYELSEGVQRVIASPSWETGIPSCNSQISFALIDLDTNLSVDNQIIKLDYSPPKISILASKNATKARLYQLSLQGSIGSSMTEVIFSIMITNLCPSAMALPEMILNQQYTLGDPSLIIEIPEWKDSLGYNNCGPIFYSANADGISLDSSWIRFDHATRKFSVQTTNLLKVGVHNIKVYAKLASSGHISITSFQLTIIDPCATAYVIPSQMSSGLTYEATSMNVHPEVRYPFIKWKDDKAGKCEPIEYQISGIPDSNMTGTFIANIKPLEGSILLKLQGLILNSSQIQLLITGTLKNGQYNTSQVSITIIPDPFIKQLQSSIFKIDPLLLKNKVIVPDLKMRLKSINNKGMIVIQFSKPLMQVTNFSLLEDRQAFSFMIQGNGIASQAKIVSWNIVEWKTYFIKVQLMIEDSDKISLGESQDQLKVVIKDPQFFRSSDAGSIILMNSLAQMKFPPQQSNTTFAKTFDQVTGGTKQVLSGTLVLNFIICLIFGASMSNMWQLLNIVQIITMLPMLRIPYSSTFLTTTDVLRTLAQFDILPNWLSFKYFRENILGLSSFDDLAKFNPLIEANSNSTKLRLLLSSNQTFQIKSEDDIGPRLISIGIESPSIVMNLGSLGDMVIGMVLLSIAIQGIRLFFDCWSIFRNIYDFFAGILFFNAYIQASNQGYLYFSIVTLHSINNLSTNDKTFDRIFTIIMLIYIIIYPIFTLIYLIRVQPKISFNEKITGSSGSFYELVQTNSGRGPILNVFVFLIRRIVLALSFYFLCEHKEFQITILMLSSFAILIYQCHYKPFISKQDTFFEFFNESTLLAISYCLLASLQFETRHTSLDYGILGLIMFFVAVNFCNFIYSSFRDLKVTCKNIGQKSKKFLDDLTRPKPCCNQAHQNSSCSKNCSHKNAAAAKKQTVKLQPQINFSESEKEETNDKLVKLSNALSQAQSSNPRARFVVVDLGSPKRKKNQKEMIEEIMIEEQAEEEESKKEQEDLTDITQSLKELKKDEVKNETKREERQSSDAYFNKRNSGQNSGKRNTNEFDSKITPRQLNESNWSSEWDQEKHLGYPKESNEDDVTEFKIPYPRIYHDQDDIIVENDNKDRNLLNHKVQEEEVKDFKHKLMFIHRVVKKRKQRQNKLTKNYWDQVIDL